MSNSKRQASFQSQFTRHVGFCKKIPDTASLHELKERLKNVLSLYEEFRQVQNEIESEVGDDFIDDQYALRSQIEDFYYLIVSALRTKIDELKLAQEPPQVQQRNANNNNTVDIKLPRIEIPVFTGDYKAWPEFKDLFESLIHNNDKLKDVQKFQHLKNALDGTAKGLIKTLHMTDANYQEARKRIHDRFQHKRFIVESHLDTLFGLTRIQNEDAPETQQSTTHKQFNNKNHQKTSQQIMPSNSFKSVLCNYCNKTGHMTGFCPEYVSLSHESKTNFVKSKKLCFNCLRPNHALAACTNKASCSNCGKRHHTSLHFSISSDNRDSSRQSQNVASQSNQHKPQNQPHQVHAVNSTKRHQDQVLLATAVVNVTTASGLKIPARALIDKGGDHSMIQEKFAKQLELVHHKKSIPILGVGEVVVQTETQLVKITIESITDPHFKLDVEVYTMKSISGHLPAVPINRHDWPHLKGIKLADNQFEKSAPIQLLLGAEVYEEIVLNGIIKKQENSPTAINSRLGWLLFGKVEARLEPTVGLHIHHVSQNNERLEDALRSFWELEEVPMTRKFTVKEQQAEEIFRKSKYRNEEGRYVVALPFDPSKAAEELGDSRAIAVQCLYRLEKRFQSNPTIKERYIKYIQALIDSNHAELVPIHRMGISSQSKFYLPHHPVLKESSITTKLRVVFNASQKTRSGVSLNEKLLVGPKIQDELFDILIRWRKHCIAFIADVEKMYRQVEIIADHRDYQRFLWRFSTNDPITEYRITRVIDGTAPAQFLATRALRQLAEDLQHTYPKAAQVIHEDFYIDDLSSGSHNIQSAIKLQNGIINLLKQGGFILKKWPSNSQEVLENVPKENQHEPDTYKNFI